MHARIRCFVVGAGAALAQGAIALEGSLFEQVAVLVVAVADAVAADQLVEGVVTPAARVQFGRGRLLIQGVADTIVGVGLGHLCFCKRSKRGLRKVICRVIPFCGMLN
ncbi:hypothetical protein AR540_04325 [Pseudomonas sp. EpS/L25]|nr:hypothetical protein AR540_04325 [Pseudomonas sp. EpS/L25]